MKNNQKGFSSFEGLLVFIVIVLIAAVGWLVYDRQNKPVTETTQNNQQAETASSRPKDVTSVKIGETGSHYGNQIIVHKAHLEEPAYVLGSNVTEDDRTFLVVDFTITNKSGQTSDYSQVDFKLETTDGKVLTSTALTAKGKEWDAPTLKDGASTSGKIAFAVENGQDNGAVVLWQSPDWVTPSETVKITL